MSCRLTKKKNILPHLLYLYARLSTVSLDEHCIEFEFRTDPNYDVDLIQNFLALRLKLITGRGYETYNPKEFNKEHKDESKKRGSRRYGRRVNGRRPSSSYGCSCKQRFAFNFC